MKRRHASTTATVLDMLQLLNRKDSWLMCCGSMFLLYVTRYATKKLKVLHRNSHEMLKVVAALQWIIVGLLLQYLSNLLSIILYKADLPPLPFETFQELKATNGEGTLTLVMEPKLPVRYLNISDLLESDQVKWVTNVKEVQQLLMQNPSLTVFVCTFAIVSLIFVSLNFS